MIAIYCGSEMDTTGKPTWRQKNRRVRDDEVAVDRSEKLDNLIKGKILIREILENLELE